MIMDIKIQVIQINQVNIYKFSAFPEERIKNIVSELNVHYDKINNYIEAGISGDTLNLEVINSLAKLKEISRLAPYKINIDPYSGDFRLGIDLLESVVALLKTDAGHNSTQKNLLDLGCDLLEKLYSFSFDNLVNGSLLYQWLKSKDLIRNHTIIHWGGVYESTPDDKIRFKPTEDELESFYNRNQQKIHEYMVFDMNDNKEESNPMSDQQASDYYHYHQVLKQFEI